MAIGNYYPVSGSVVDADLFLGTKAGSNNTVNYAAQTVVDYLNTNSKVSIGGQLSFKFVEVPNVPKTISFLGGGGNNTLFSSITQLIVSTSDLYGANITVFLNYLDGSEILLSQQNQPNFFGHYKITSYNQIGISAFYTLNLNFIGGNGNITKDTYYNMGSFILSSNLTVPTLNQVLTAGNTSLLDAKIGSLYLYDSTEFDYGYLSLNDSDFKFYDTFGPSVTMTRNAITLIGGIGGFNGTLSLPVITANRTYTLPNATGTIALTSDIPSLTGYVPYIGATGAVNLGDYDLTVNSITVGKGAGSILTNTAIGFEALKLNTTGQQNTALGYNSLRSVTTGGGNIGIGVNAGYLITTGVRNNFIGLAAGAGTTTGSNNTFMGDFVGRFNTTGSANTLLGKNAGFYFATGNDNTALGYESGYNNESGNRSVFAGYQSGYYAGSGGVYAISVSNSVLIGSNTRVSATPATNQIVIGDSAIGIGDNTVTLGNDAIVTTALKGNVGIGTTSITRGKLEVKQSTDASNGGIAIVNSAVSGSLRLWVDSTGVSNIANGTTSNISILSSGNVGIGTTNPTARLQINAQGALSTDIAFKVRNSTNTADLFNVNGLGNVGIGVGTPAGKLDLFDSASSSLYVRTGSVGANWVTGTVLSQLGTYTDHPLVFKTNDTARMRIVNTTGNVLINTTTDIPSSKLTVESTTQGFLPPRMTTAQRNAIASPATGLIVYDTDLLSEFQYNGTAWVTYQSQLNGTGFVKASGTTISYDNNTYAPIIVKDFVNSGVSGTNVNTIIRSYLIASNTFVLNDSLDILCSVFKNTTSQNVTLRVYFNTTVSLTGATLIGTYVLNPTTKFVNFQRTNIYAGSSFYCFPSAVSNITDRAVTNVDLSVVPFDNLVNNYIIFAIQLTSSSDAGYIGGIRITK